MSGARYSILPARAVFDARLSPSELRLLAALGSYADDEGWCYPNQTTLAERLSLSRQFVCGAIKKLVSTGYVETEARTAKGRGRVGLNYRVKLDLPRDQVEANALKEAVVASDGQRGRCQDEPMSAGADNGPPVVVVGLQPLSVSDDNGLYRTTNPTERTQQVKAVSAAPKPARLDGREAIAAYNAAAARAGWVAVKGALTAARKAAVCKRLRDHGMEGWLEQIAIAETMPFLGGANDRGWRMNLDFFVRDSGWTKISEGAYARAAKPEAGEVAGIDQEAELAAARERYEAHKRSKQQQQAALPL